MIIKVECNLLDVIVIIPSKNNKYYFSDYLFQQIETAVAKQNKLWRILPSTLSA